MTNIVRMNRNEVSGQDFEFVVVDAEDEGRIHRSIDNAQEIAFALIPRLAHLRGQGAVHTF